MTCMFFAPSKSYLFEQIQNQTKPNQNQRYSQNHSFGLFSPTVTCWVSKIMYSSWEIQWQPQIVNLNQSKSQQNKTKTKNITKTMVLTNFWPTATCWVSKSMYSSWEIQWWPQRTNQEPTTPNQNQKYGKKQGLGQFLAYSDMLGVKNQHSSWGIQQLIERARLFGPTCQSILVVYKHIK